MNDEYTNFTQLARISIYLQNSNQENREGKRGKSRATSTNSTSTPRSNLDGGKNQLFSCYWLREILVALTGSLIHVGLVSAFLHSRISSILKSGIGQNVQLFIRHGLARDRLLEF
jgi:hypothetical protein